MTYHSDFHLYTSTKMSVCLFSNFYFFQVLYWSNTLITLLKDGNLEVERGYILEHTIPKCLLQVDFARLQSMDRVLAF